MDDIDTGGPAFPTWISGMTWKEEPQTNLGMTLRDFFAAAALTGILSGRLHLDAMDFFMPRSDDNPVAYQGKRDMSAEEISSLAIHYADAMLKERTHSKDRKGGGE